MIDYSNDYLQWDNTQAVVLTTRRNNVGTSHSVSHALQGDITRRVSQMSGVALQGDEQVWQLPHALLPAVEEINPGDRIEACDGVTWVVQWATQRGIGSHKTHWECIARRG